MFNNNDLSLENSFRLWMEVLSSSLTKDQYYLYREGYASNFSEVKYRPPSNRTKCNIWGKPGSSISKSQNVLKSSWINTTINSHHQLPYEVNYIKYRLCNAYTTPHSFCLKCPLTSQDLYSSPVPVNYTKWCIRHWFYQSTVVASNPIITCLLVQ